MKPLAAKLYRLDSWVEREKRWESIARDLPELDVFDRALKIANSTGRTIRIMDQEEASHD